MQLQTLDQTSVGGVTRALIRSGFGHELLDASDEQARRQPGELAADFSQPGAVSAAGDPDVLCTGEGQFRNNRWFAGVVRVTAG